MRLRIREESIIKEENYICGKCGARGDCAEDKKHALTCPNKGKKGFNFAMYWDENAGEHGKIVCLKCGHWLETEEELEELCHVVEVQQYGFYLRFASDNFIPCDGCQKSLENYLFKERVYLAQQNSVTLQRSDNGGWTFILGFLKTTPLFVKEFVPCKTCQEKLQKVWENKELHIGNEDKPLVEFWRRWEIDDKRTDKLSKVEDMAKKGKLNFAFSTIMTNLKEQKTTEEFDECLYKLACYEIAKNKEELE